MPTYNLGIILCEEGLLWGIYRPGADRFLATNSEPLLRVVRGGRDGPSFVSLAKLMSEIRLPPNFYPDQPAHATSNQYLEDILTRWTEKLKRLFSCQFGQITLGVAHTHSERVRYFLRTIFSAAATSVTLTNVDRMVALYFGHQDDQGYTLCYSLLHHGIEVSLYRRDEEKLTQLDIETSDDRGINRLDLELASAANGCQHPSQLSPTVLQQFNSRNSDYRAKLFSVLEDKHSLAKTYDPLLQPSLDASRRLLEKAGSKAKLFYISSYPDTRYFENRVQMATGKQVQKISSLQLIAALCGVKPELEHDTLANTETGAAPNILNKDKNPEDTTITPERTLAEFRKTFAQLGRISRNLPQDILVEISEQGIEMAIRWAADLYIGQNKMEEAYKLYKKILPKDAENLPRLREVAATLCLNQAKSLYKQGAAKGTISRWLTFTKNFQTKNPEIIQDLNTIYKLINPRK